MSKTTLSPLHSKRIKRTHKKKQIEQLKTNYPIRLAELEAELAQVEQEIAQLEQEEQN